MPNRETHGWIGAGLGLTAGVILSDNLPTEARWIYSLAAGVGGTFGGVMPDVLEPAIHAHHRDVCHSVAAGSGLSLGGLGAASSSAKELRGEAAGFRAMRLALPEGDHRRTSMAAREFLIYALLGFSAGFVAGYLSHLVADAATPRGIPVVARRVG